MRRLLPLFLILQTVNCGSCPEGFDLYRNGECRGLSTVLNSIDSLATQNAVWSCAQIKGKPVIIRSAEDQAYWKLQGTKQGRHLLLGLECNTISTKWQWVDRTPVDFIPSEGTGDMTAPCTSFSDTCVWFQRFDGVWARWCDNDDEIFDVYCTTQLHQPQLSPDGCLGFQDDSDDGVCYLVAETTQNWQNAQLNCMKLGANLASIHNDNENSFVRRVAVSKGAVRGLFLGAIPPVSLGNFGWIDGSSWNYENYAPGFPESGHGDCLEMDTSTSEGQWKNTDCASQLPVACIREQKPVIERNITCSNDVYLEGEIVTSPGFPFNASLPCEYTLKVDAGKKVEVEIFLEANSCCDFLTVYDGDISGGVLAKLTGEYRNVTYSTTSSNTMKLKWQPNGGVNVRGLAMTFRGV